MAKLTIENLAPWDGDYPFDDGFFTNRELHRIKEISGIRAGEIFDALAAGDAVLGVALAAVIMARTGVQVDVDDLWDAKLGDIAIDWSADAGPPEPTSPPSSENESASDPTVNESSSGTDGTDS